MVIHIFFSLFFFPFHFLFFQTNQKRTKVQKYRTPLQVATFDVLILLYRTTWCYSLTELSSLVTQCRREKNLLRGTSFFFFFFYGGLSAAMRRGGRCGAWRRTTRRTRRCSRRWSGPAAPAEPIAEQSTEEDPASTLPICRIRRRTLSTIISANTLSPKRIATSATTPPLPPSTPVSSPTPTRFSFFFFIPSNFIVAMFAVFFCI